MNGPTIECPHCGYGLASGAELVEALEAKGACPQCQKAIPVEFLEAAAEAWSDADAIQEGAERAADAEESEEEEWLSAGPDFGDDGEEDEEEEE